MAETIGPVGAELVVDALGVGTVVVDRQARIVLWNRWMESASGLAAADALGRTLEELFPELAGGRVPAAVAEALERGFSAVLSQSLNKAPLPLFADSGAAGGRERLQQKIRVLPLNTGGAAPHCLIEIQDVSLAVRREKALNEQKKFLNTILENEPECVAVVGADGSLLQINRTGLDQLEEAGIDEVRRRGLADYVLPDFRSAFAALVSDVFSGCKGVLEYRIRAAKGTVRWLETHAAPLFDGQGKAAAMLAVTRDTTARREAEATTRALIDANMESAILIDPDGAILAINEIAARRLGSRANELVGRDLYALLPAELAASRRDSVRQVFEHGVPALFHDCRDGIEFEVNVYPVFDAARRVAAIAIYATDVTERMRMQAVDELFHDIDRQVLHGHKQLSLFTYVCAEVARVFDYEFVWVGRKLAGGVIDISAWGGKKPEYLDDLRKIGVRWDTSPLGQGPAGTAIRSGQVQTVVVAEPGFQPWRVAAQRCGLAVVLSIPLILRGEVYGCFTLASAKDSAFDPMQTVRRLSDIANRLCVAIERSLDQQQLLLLETALSSAANGVFITDKQGRIQWLNDAFEAMTGYSREEAVGATPRLLRIGGNDDDFFREMLDSIAEGAAWSGESVEKRKDGTSFSVRQTITPIHNADGEVTHFISILEDVTETRAAEASILRMAHYDYLTGLPNRALFTDRLGQALARAKRVGDGLALMFIDLDRFKSVNDTYGHDIGDLLLKGVAERLVACVRGSDTVARLAGDEFTVILSAVISAEDARVVADKIIAAMAVPFRFDALEYPAALSIGIAVYPDDTDDEAMLLKAADTAMYAAKRAGGRGYRFFAADLERRPAADATQ